MSSHTDLANAYKLDNKSRQIIFPVIKKARKAAESGNGASTSWYVGAKARVELVVGTAIIWNAVSIAILLRKHVLVHLPSALQTKSPCQQE